MSYWQITGNSNFSRKIRKTHILSKCKPSPKRCQPGRRARRTRAFPLSSSDQASRSEPGSRRPCTTATSSASSHPLPAMGTPCSGFLVRSRLRSLPLSFREGIPCFAPVISPAREGTSLSPTFSTFWTGSPKIAWVSAAGAGFLPPGAAPSFLERAGISLDGVKPLGTDPRASHRI